MNVIINIPVLYLDFVLHAPSNLAKFTCVEISIVWAYDVCAAHACTERHFCLLLEWTIYVFSINSHGFAFFSLSRFLSSAEHVLRQN